MCLFDVARTQRSSGLTSVITGWPGLDELAGQRHAHVHDAGDRRVQLG